MKIALTYTGSEEKHDNYINWLTSGKEKLEVITISAEKDNLHELLSCDALVLSGGVDIHPDFYGKGKQYKNAPEKFNKKRDIFEAAAYTLTQEHNLPVLAVCRGMQLVNCMEGGNLKQDIGKQANEKHRARNLVDKAHGCTVDKNSLLYEIVQSDRVTVNSAHHQAVKKPGHGLKVNCIADDDTIEGMERTDTTGKPFLLCIQWHPERMYKFQLADSPVSKAIREYFIAAIQKQVKKK